MKPHALTIALLATLPFASPAHARETFDTPGSGGGGSELDPVLQCVPYARAQTGIAIYGDAHTWWGQAEGRYARGSRPMAGAVMAIRPHGNSRLGHVAAVSRVLDSRTVLLHHANWSSPGQIERDVKAVDVSDTNDWSKVRIWHGPSGSLGTRHWPIYGFIYKAKPGEAAKPARASRDFIADVIAGTVR